jgi:hypothetical protein
MNEDCLQTGEVNLAMHGRKAVYESELSGLIWAYVNAYNDADASKRCSKRLRKRLAACGFSGNALFPKLNDRRYLARFLDDLEREARVEEEKAARSTEECAHALVNMCLRDGRNLDDERNNPREDLT